MGRIEKIVAIGGGHGLSQILYNFKDYVDYLTAIVTPFDDGGSSGRLRDQYNVPSAGDYSRAVGAVSRLSEIDIEILNHRFDHGDYNGHSAKNGLFTAAWEEGPEYAQGFMKRLYQLDIGHYVYFSSLTPAILHAHMVNPKTKKKKVLNGENKLDHIRRPWKIEDIYLEPIPKGYEPSVKAIKEADMTVIAPGTLYGSILPNILIPEIKEAIQGAIKVVYVCNLVTELGHTDDCTAANHVEILNRYDVYPHIVIINTRELSPEIEERYRSEGKTQVIVDNERLSKLVRHIIKADLLLESPTKPGALHDPAKTARALMQALYTNV